ncbi:hypothetical protein CIL03_15660 [Virgibacillus indicus]|uniref:Uncharacterized protein n=1 Tax=Virgibacillus indicus TaxID=2024554 RepID=A0A265N686_9BACI|nr:hypothetical protein [Virgibacillus indicus]OZU87528.1 hypothetical protein CIL03_15660 [Virgibacillus indicus]
MKKIASILGIGFFLSILITGCGEITIPSEDGSETKIDLKGLEDGNLDISVEDSEGETVSMDVESDGENTTLVQSDGETEVESNIGENVTLPEDFPSEFPFPEEIKLTAVQTVTDAETKTYMIHYEYDQDLESISAIYKEYAESKGYTISLEQKMENSYNLNAGDDEGKGFSAYLGYLEENTAMISVTSPME